MPKWTKEQEMAIKTVGKNIIVSAGAGSGKTAVLSERVLEHVKNGINVDDLLILTFTNAAASEMKDRIRKKLKSYPEYKEQLDKIDLAYITTFDAFALSIVKRFKEYLNISSKITIIDNSIITLKKEEILENIFDNLYASNDPLFLKLLNDLTLKDDKEIFLSIISLNNKLDNLYNKKELLDNYLNNFYNDITIDKLINEYVNILLSNIKEISSQIDNLSTYIDTTYIDKLNTTLSNLLSSKTYENIRFNVYNLDRLPIMRDASLEAKKIKEEISKILKNLKELTTYNTLEEIKESIYKTKDYVSIIVHIIKLLDTKISEFKKENDAYEFIDISKLAIKLLEDNEYLCSLLKNKYKEILIDEYQDTNDLQERFISLIANSNVYMVGDIKQSIYRFRNANPDIFKSKYEVYSQGDLGIKIDLNKNFRSRSEVLDNINLIFNLIMDENIGGASYLESHQMIFGLEPYNLVNKENYNMDLLCYESLEDKSFSDTEIEIFTVAKDIKEKIENNYEIMDKDTNEKRVVNYSDFVILMDRSTNFNLYKKVFEYLNIPITIYRDSTISDSVDISIIKNIYNLIILIKKKDFGKLFSYSYMAVARSYLFSISDEEILTTIKTRNYSETKIYEICYKLAKKLDDLNNIEIYDKIINEFNFWDKIITTGNVLEHIVTLDSIEKIITNATNFGYTPYEFLEYLDKVSASGLDIKLSLNKEASNSVKIMTIHTSKGLEYPICYFTGLSKKFNISDLKEKFYFDNDYGFITPYLDKSINSTILKILLKNKYIKEEISEKLRLFYVGLTRAREKMILVGKFMDNELAYKKNGIISDDVRLKYMSFLDILNSTYKYINKYIKNIDISKLNLTKDYNFTKVNNDNIIINNNTKLQVEDYICNKEIISNKKISKVASKIYDKEEKKNIELGLKMHYLFEITDFSNPDYSNMNEFEKNCISKFISTGILDNFINIYKEYEFIYNEKEALHGIIDLLIEKEDTCIIVDYKLKNTTDSNYLKQLNYYKEYIEYITGKKTSTYLYSIIDSKLVLLDNGQ